MLCLLQLPGLQWTEIWLLQWRMYLYLIASLNISNIYSNELKGLALTAGQLLALLEGFVLCTSKYIFFKCCWWKKFVSITVFLHATECQIFFFHLKIWEIFDLMTFHNVFYFWFCDISDFVIFQILWPFRIVWHFRCLSF